MIRVVQHWGLWSQLPKAELKNSGLIGAAVEYLNDLVELFHPGFFFILIMKILKVNESTYL